MHGLSDGIAGMPIKYIEVGYSVFVEERTSYTAMESDVRMSASR